jgi:rhodanese-related sulfurtransferase
LTQEQLLSPENNFQQSDTMPISIQPQDLAQLLQQQPVFLLDVRLPAEHNFVALPNSVLIPIQELATRWNEIQPKPNDKLVIYCHHGVRSWHAAMFLEQQGFTNVHSLEGGIDAWALEVDEGMKRYA